MPTLKKLIKQKLDRLDTVPEAFYSAVGKAQQEVLNRLLELLGSLDTVGGVIQPTEANLLIAEQIKNELKKVLFQGEYLRALVGFGKEFSVQAGITDAYFAKVFDFEFKELYQAALKASQTYAIETLSQKAIDVRFLTPLKQQIDTSVVTGQSFADAVKNLRTFVEGEGEKEGLLLRYVKQVARDGFSVADRSYTNLIADDLGVEWYMYRGGLVKDSRDFCVERNGQYFHRSEIEAMAALNWQGKAKGTDAKTIFAFAGGYQCMHSWIPVSEFDVPEEVKSRVKQLQS